jgi:aryl-alcohol dehydrogenase-like predicted oxidoreductase
MLYTNLGRSGLKVSRFCLGTMNFGPITTEEDSYKIMDHALEVGINFWDSANVYGWKAGEGYTEQIIGRYFAQGGGRREKVVLATKVYGGMGRDSDGTNGWPNYNGLSAKHIREACDDSLKRLQTDYIDLYQMHHIDRSTPWEEIYQAFETLVQQGKVLYFGSSNFAGWNIAAAREIAKQRNFLGLVSEQTHYNLNCRKPELEVIPACEKYGIGLIPWSPLGGGILGGILEKTTAGRRASERGQEQIAKLRPQLEKWESYCKEIGENPADFALAWLLSNPVVTAPIIGPRTFDQLDGVLKALEITVTKENHAVLDEIFPGYKTAPEDYAW